MWREKRALCAEKSEPCVGRKVNPVREGNVNPRWGSDMKLETVALKFCNGSHCRATAGTGHSFGG